MTALKLNFTTRFFIFSLFFLGLSSSTYAQNNSFHISLGASVGYTPLVTLDEANYSGLITSLHGDMEYGKLMGRLQYSKPIVSTFDTERLVDANAYHGSLGYQLSLKEELSLGLLLGGGATVITYKSLSDEFTNVSPQVGIEVIPIYRISKHFSIQGSARYYKGFEAGDRGDASDLFDLGIGLRISL